LLEALIRQEHALACCPITITEVYAGMRPHEEIRTSGLLMSLQLFPVTFAVARLAGLLKRDYGKKGTTLAVTDVTIAAVAIHTRLALITDNVKHFPMPDLTIYPLPR
jgi:predicted nucleic acid-binding protein